MVQRDLEEEKKKEDARRLRDFFLELQTAAYGYAQTYTTIVIFGGYAGLFTIWGLAKDKLTAGQTYWAGLLLGVSILIFVLFEIFRMVIVSIEHIEIRALIVHELPPDELFARRAELAKRQNYRMVRLIYPVWIVALGSTVLTGVGSAGVLIWAFSAGILSPLPGVSSP